MVESTAYNGNREATCRVVKCIGSFDDYLTMRIRTCRISTPCNRTWPHQSGCRHSRQCSLSGRCSSRSRPRPWGFQHHRACALRPLCSPGRFQVVDCDTALAPLPPGRTAELSSRQYRRFHRSVLRFQASPASRSSSQSPCQEGKSTGTIHDLRGGDLRSSRWSIRHRWHASAQRRRKLAQFLRPTSAGVRHPCAAVAAVPPEHRAPSESAICKARL